MKNIFAGPNGIRTGFRFFAFAGMVLAFNWGLVHLTVRFVIRRLGIILTDDLEPVSAGLSNAVLLLSTIAATLIMARFERRRWSDYGLPGSGSLGRRFWEGAAFGFLAVSLLMGLIALAHGYSPGSLNLKGPQMLLYAALWMMASLLAGFSEEILFRGYAQFTLASGMGSWPAAALLSFTFGGFTSGALRFFTQPHESWMDWASAGLLALFACLTLRRTRDLRFAIGFHAAFDFALLYVYSGPRGGQLAQGKLLEATFHGPRAITGGLLGPQTSVLALPVFALLFLGFDALRPNSRAAQLTTGGDAERPAGPPSEAAQTSR